MASTAPGTTSVCPILVYVSFSETVTGFERSDIVASNATVCTFEGSGGFYSFYLLPMEQGTVTADIASGVATGGGKPNQAAPQFSRTYDSDIP
jgi:hypothetical protein